ncbi:ABC-type multidrug transport system, ATPase and permease component [Aequorivita sublithincola DSM 14238]|uniref:ABC-type multidrug transport system, ATPase and permease component n=1 Tax=Aequorivita sublithincola (strain DSM 14238 / LMG 21431 / ACAM 643 / 9-3) TaxID=746697 RepID=I3YY24_AEQSU|nr:ABC transporter ATP-binding protein [Aequorivita sublithincola]AFL81892.1 ABC-type multidrug transport system, ATPase and permease component [Aequorivita sublithincola DSM 14238]
MNYFKKILRYVIPYKRFAYLNIFFNILYALFGTLSFVALIPIFEVIFNDKRKSAVQPVYEGISKIKDYLQDYFNYFIIENINKYGEFKVLMYMVAIIISLFLLKNLSNYLAMFYSTYMRNGVLRDLRNDLYRKVVQFPLAFYSEKRKGDTISRLSGDVDEVKNSVLSVLEMIVREPLTIIFTLIAMLLISAKLTLFVFLFLPISGFIISKIGKSLKRGSLKVQQEQGVFLSILEETMGGLRIIKAFHAENIFQKKFEDSNQRFYTHSNKVMNKQNLASPVSELLGIITIGVLLVFGGYLVFIDKTLEASFFIGYISLAYNILTPAKAIAKASYSIKRADGSAQRILELLEAENTITDIENPVQKEGFDGVISIKNISFKYEDQYVLKDFSLEIPKGKTVALVGQSGSGKSTIANLLTRFYDVNQGSIQIDGVDIKDISKRSLRGLMGIVSQDSILFNDTVGNNLKLGKPLASDVELMEAAEISNSYEFIKDLPEGFETNIGDSGNKLSGGQKQRLSIARAVLKNPPIMILDEATSALDTESERLVQDALEKMMKNRTSIVIAHRLSTIQNADNIVVLSKGKIVEQGKHQELLEKKGVYYSLVEMQSLA